MVKQKYYAVARGRVTGIYCKPYDSRRQTDGFSNSLCRSFPRRSDADQYLRENCDSGPGAVHINTNDNGWVESRIIDLTNDDSDDDDDDDDDDDEDSVVDNNNDVIDLTGDDDNESPPRRILRSSTIAKRQILRSSKTVKKTTKPAPSVLQTLPNILNATRETMRSASTQSFPSHLNDGMPAEGGGDCPFKYPCWMGGKIVEGRSTRVGDNKAVKNALKALPKDPYMIGNKENGGRATVMGDNKAGKNALKGLSKDQQFFRALLLSTVNEFVEAAASDTKSKALWEAICNRAGLTALESRVEPSYQCVKAHFNARAVLILEEVRAAISGALSERNPTVSLKVVLRKRKKQTLSFQKKDLSNDFKEEELQFLQSGAVFECFLNGSGNEQALFLGCLIGADTNKISRSKIFHIEVFRDLSQVSTSSEWTLNPIGKTFINYMRQYKAVTALSHRKVPFLDHLMGHPRQKNEAFTLTDRYGDDFMPMSDLNESQERAASSFLHSPPGTITLVQGPPGTGKSTLLVSIMCRYLKTEGGRLMVCASTNKAVSLLAIRFLQRFSHRPINAVLVGNEKKLVEQDDSPLRFMHATMWIQAMTKDYTGILQMEPNTEGSTQFLVKLASHLLHRTEGLQETLLNSAPVSSKVGKLAIALDDDSDFSFDAILNLVGALLQDLSALPSRALMKELVESADIIFATLTTAGNSVVGGSREIDDLIVDEAAAATEPEIYIPFRLKPKRLLIVGDPKQLQPCVVSRRAKMLGLGLSLQERMMNGCGHKYTMLNVQYRMHPSISAFPSREFYNGSIANGNNTREAHYLRRSPWLEGRPYTFLQVDGTEERPPNRISGLRNPEEAAVIVDIVQKLVDLGQSDENWNSSDRIRIITFYQEQVSLIKKKMAEKGLGGVLVATVDSSQGCEADVVILSFVRSNGGSAGFLRDDRRMNVAMTRARFQLVCVGNLNYMSDLMNAPTLRSLCADAKSRKVAVLSQNRILHNLETTRQSSAVGIPLPRAAIAHEDITMALTAPRHPWH